MHATTLCFDFGNTRSKFAVFENDELKEVIFFEKADEKTAYEILDKYKPSAAILTSVIAHDTTFDAIFEARIPFHTLSATSKLNFTTPVGTPETIGADRLALCAAAVDLYPNQHSLIIGMGSCITYNFINRFHEFLGGGISPGMRMRFRAVHEFTAKLPMVDAAMEFPLVGYDTKTNLQSGIQWGILHELEGMAALYEEKYANINVLLTGGDIPFFACHLKKKIFADPNLTFKGLYAISKLNA